MIYLIKRVEKSKKEREIVMNMLIDNLINCTEFDEYCELMRKGYTYKNVIYQIANDTSMGFIEYKQKLLDVDIQVPHRLEKLYVLLTGKNFQGEKIWNNGNMLRIKLSDYE